MLTRIPTCQLTGKLIGNARCATACIFLDNSYVFSLGGFWALPYAKLYFLALIQ